MLLISYKSNKSACVRSVKFKNYLVSCYNPINYHFLLGSSVSLVLCNLFSFFDDVTKTEWHLFVSSCCAKGPSSKLRYLLKAHSSPPNNALVHRNPSDLGTGTGSGTGTETIVDGG